MRVRWSWLLSVATLVVAALLVLGTLAKADSPGTSGATGADTPVLKVTASAPIKTVAIPTFEPNPGPTSVYLRLNAAGDDMKAAKKALLDRTSAVEKGLTAAGLTLQPMFYNAQAGDPYSSPYGSPYGMAPGPGLTSQLKVNLNATLEVWATSREQVLTAMQVGADNGALSAGTEPTGPGSVHSFMSMGYSTPQPTTAETSVALAAATARAKDLAALQAKAAGVTLGKLKSIQTEPPQAWCSGRSDCGGISVTLTYEIGT